MPLLTSDMWKKTVSVLAHKLLLPQRAYKILKSGGSFVLSCLNMFNCNLMLLQCFGVGVRNFMKSLPIITPLL